jgi:radical SAM superfamily enzyme YgiQ (UPF0313 family)
LDFSCEPFYEAKLIPEIKSADIVGLSVLSFSLGNTKEIIRIIRRIKPNIKVIIGGPHCTLFPEKALMETQADICVQGDGEFIISDIKKAIMGKMSLKNIPGVFYKEDGKIHKGLPLKLINDLDSVSFPARHLANKYNYGNQFNPKIKNGEFTSIITSRGCPFSCKFCSRNSVSMKTYRTRSTENIFNELKEIKNKGYNYVAFVDDSFLSNKNQSHELFDKIINEKLKLKFIITAARVDSANEKLFKKMRKAGVTHIQYGLESGNQEILDFYNKNTTIEKIENAVNLSHKLGFFNMGSFILGAPIETKQQFKKTIDFAKKLPLDSISFVPLKYMAGSELWCKAVEAGNLSDDDYLSQAGNEKGLGMYPESEIIRYCINARGEYYLRPRFMFGLLIKSLKNNDLGFLQSYLSMFLSNIFKGFRFLGLTRRK